MAKFDIDLSSKFIPIGDYVTVIDLPNGNVIAHICKIAILLGGTKSIL